jgi:hypothetical protein
MVGKAFLLIIIVVMASALNVQANEIYNQNFEEGAAGPGKPLDWTASSQDYGYKSTSYFVVDTNPLPL